MNIEAKKYIESATNWFDSKLRDVDRDSDKDEKGEKLNEIGKFFELPNQEVKNFGITLKEFKANGYEISNN